MPSIDDLASAIIRQEGYGTPNAVTINNNNNPGALRSSPYQIGTSNGFAQFASYEDGYNALVYDLQSKVNRGLSLRDFVYTYAPPTENDTSGYLNNLSSWLGIGADTKLGDWLNGNNNSSDSGDSSGSVDIRTNLPLILVGAVGLVLILRG
jgi:hypothetical protein